MFANNGLPGIVYVQYCINTAISSLSIQAMSISVYIYLLGAVAATLCGPSAAYPSPFAPLNQYPFLLTHDAATGELDERRDHVVADWAKTQSVGLAAQLDCGARAFDYRPYSKDGHLFAHHGGIVVHKPMDESLVEIADWCGANSEDLVILAVSACDGDADCYSASLELVRSHGIQIITECSDLQSLTYESARSLARMDNGGSLLAVFDCVESQYDPTNVCYGKGFICYESSWGGSTEEPWEHMRNYMQDATKQVPVDDGRLWMAQALWESDAYGCVTGTLHNSSLLMDETRSKMNEWVAQSIEDGVFKYLNFLEVNNVCDGGDRIVEALNGFDVP